MIPYLIQNPPARSQFRAVRRLNLSPIPGKLTGCTVLHSAESILDIIGPDTGAEGVARYIVSRDTPGSYHDLVDSDSGILVVPYSAEAYQDGTGSNPWALSLSFALAAADWPKLTPERRDAFLRQGAAAFRRQQEWRRANGHPLTTLRRITRAQSEAGEAGFISHGDRDPGRRSDPGAAFPWTRFFQLCSDNPQEEDVPTAAEVWSQPVEKPDRTTQPAYAVLAAAAKSGADASAKLDQLLAVVGGLSAALTALAANSDLTAQEIQDASEVGAARAIAKRITDARVDLNVTPAEGVAP